jgi:serine/threonine protein kinase
MVNTNLIDFSDLVRRSQLVEPDQLGRIAHELELEVGRDQASQPDCLAAKLIEAGLLTTWQCENLLRGRHKGFFLKQYKLLDILGTGGMSHVYLAEHRLMLRRVAIKVLPKNRIADSSYLGRFHREAQAVAALDHRNIVRAYDVGQEQDIHFLVMEYVEGRDLQAIVRDDGPLECVQAVDYLRQAAEGLDHAHRVGLVHRDIKPANLLVDRQGIVKLLDLGLARFTGDERMSLTMLYDENVLGTADYLAPEQAVDSHTADGRADLYSLGCSLFYLLTSRPPFNEGTMAQRLVMHQKTPPPDLRRIRPDVPDDLAEICLRLMAKNPDHRYRTAREVAEVFGAWLAARGHAVDPERGTSLRRPGDSGKAKRAAAARSGGSSKTRRNSGRSLVKQATALDESVFPSDLPAAHSSPSVDTQSKRARSTLKASLDGSGSGSTAGPGGGPVNGSMSGSRSASSPRSGTRNGSTLESDARRRSLPVAQRLDEDVPPPLALAEEAAAGTSVAIDLAMPLSNKQSSVVRRPTVPAWLWLTVAAGGILTLALATLVVLLSR